MTFADFLCWVLLAAGFSYFVLWRGFIELTKWNLQRRARKQK